VVDGYIEETLDLLTVEIHGQHAVRSGGGEQVGHELGRDRNAGLIFTILTCVAVERNNRRDALSRGASRSVDHDEQLHQVMVRRWARRLNEEYVVTANVLVDLHEGFAVRETCDRGLAERHADALANRFCESAIRVAGKNLRRGVIAHFNRDVA